MVSEILQTLIENFSSKPIYDGAANLISQYLIVISPLLLILAILFRSQLITIKSFRGEAGQLKDALIDIVLYGTALAVYVALISLLLNFFNSLYASLSQGADVKSIRDSVVQMFELAQQSESKIKDVFSKLVSWGMNGLTSMAVRSAYAWSFVYVSSLVIIMDIAKAIMISISFVLGTLVIPIHVCGIASGLLEKWIRLLSFSLVWQAVEYIFNGVFVKAATSFTKEIAVVINDSSYFGLTDSSYLYLAITIFNLLVVIGLVLAPVLAMYLTTGGAKAGGVALGMVAASSAPAGAPPAIGTSVPRSDAKTQPAQTRPLARKVL